MRTRRCSVLCHTTAVYRGRCGSSARVPRASKWRKSWKVTFPAYLRRAPRRFGCGPVSRNRQSASLRSVVIAYRARRTTSSIYVCFA